jgi:uncharacterized protein YigA (DUF484 family)
VTQKEPTLGSSSRLSARQVEDYLRENPDFFEAHPHLLSEINVPHVQSGRAISLVERQASVLRDRIKSMELRLAELLRHGQENDAITASILRWVRGILLHEDVRSLPPLAADSLARIFSVPSVALRIWQPADAMSREPWVMPATADFIGQIDAMRVPVCGPPSLSAATALLPESGRDCQSVAIVPLRVGAAPQAFGVLLLGSPDSRRFAPDMGVDFLERIGEIASAALCRNTSARS